MRKTLPLFIATLACLMLFTGCGTQPTAADHTFLALADEDDGFEPIFNGKDLDGWTPKFRGTEYGVNYKDTFVVEDGMIKAKYDKYEKFDRNFGHLFYKTSYSHYILRVEYRFVGEQVKNGPGWAFRNSGVMFHCPDPSKMTKDQDFPVCIEAQLLGQSEDNPRKRSTGNVCSPSSHYYQGDKLVRAHCVNSSSKTFPGEQWVTFELEVRGHDKIIHRINGEVVFEYERPTLDKPDKDGKTEMDSGYFALQAESHEVHFRKVEIKVLDQ